MEKPSLLPSMNVLFDLPLEVILTVPFDCTALSIPKIIDSIVVVCWCRFHYIPYSSFYDVLIDKMPIITISSLMEAIWCLFSHLLSVILFFFFLSLYNILFLVIHSVVYLFSSFSIHFVVNVTVDYYYTCINFPLKRIY